MPVKTPIYICGTWWHPVLIAILGALIYSNTLSSPFQFDDKLNIVENLFIRDIGNFWPPKDARWLGLLTFSLNYALDGLNPRGYHLANTCIHILTALSLYWLVLLTFRTPYFYNKENNVVPASWIALATALLFVAHPIQTQAVTYIVQRFASLATLLFVLSLVFYVLARLTGRLYAADSAPRILKFCWKSAPLYVAACLFALASLKTKEIAFTLPVVVVLYEALFLDGFSGLAGLPGKWRRSVAAVAVLLLAVGVYVVNTVWFQRFFDSLRATNEISRHDYLITQFRVVATYLRLLFVPVNQTIDHDYKVYTTVFEPSVFASMVLVLILLCLAAWLLQITRGCGSYLRLVSFGIWWFFITISIESSFIPIIDVMFEHRLYLPGIGIIIAVVALFVLVWERTGMVRRFTLKPALSVLAVAVIALSCTAYQRNKVWKSELTLWSDVVAKKPYNPRGYNMVGIYYLNNSRTYDAIYYFAKALEVDSSYAEARSNLGNAYIQTGRIDEGLNELLVTARANRFDAIDSGILYYSIGKAFYIKGQLDKSVESLKTALLYAPREAAVYHLLGKVYLAKNMTEKSAASFNVAHNLDPSLY